MAMEKKTDAPESDSDTSSTKDARTDLNSGVWYRSKATGLWYRNIGVAVPIDAIRIDGELILTETLNKNGN